MFECSVSCITAKLVYMVHSNIPSVPDLAVALQLDNPSVFENYVEIQCIPTSCMLSGISSL